MSSHAPVRPLRGGVFIPALLAVLLSNTASAAYVPESADTVIAELPPLRERASQITAGTSPTEQLNAANEQIELAQRTGDLRHLGYAEKTLQSLDDRSADAWVLRARIAQYRHRFEEAYQNLDRALSLQPGHRNAVLQRAALLRTNGKLAAAQEACYQLPVADPARSLCEWPIRGLRGELEPAMQALRNLNIRDGSLRLWRDSELAEMHERAGNATLARTLWASVLAGDPQHHFARRHLADNLLRDQRPQAVLQLIPQGSPHPGLEIARLQALRALGEGDWRPQAEALVRRLERSQFLYGERHERELARIQLTLLDNPARATALAAENWLRQREPEDIRLLYRAALMAHQPEASRDVGRFVEAHAYEDALLLSGELNT